MLPMPSPVSAVENLGSFVLSLVKRATVEYPQECLVSEARNLAIQVLNVGNVVALRQPYFAVAGQGPRGSFVEEGIHLS